MACFEADIRPTERFLCERFITASIDVDADYSSDTLHNVRLQSGNYIPRLKVMSLDIESARVTDLSAFNTYLPPDAPLQLAAGTASLASELVLQATDADGWLTLDSNDMEFILDGQSLRADLALDIKVVDGVPRDMVFDLSGSSVVLSGVSVTGEERSFSDDGWAASLQLTEAETTWQKPLPHVQKFYLLTSGNATQVKRYLDTNVYKHNFLATNATAEDFLTLTAYT